MIMATLPLPPNATSQVLGRKELIVFNRFGDLMFQRYDDYPGFSELGCIAHIDDVILHAPQEDMKDLSTLLKILYFCPTFVLRFILWLTQRPEKFPPGIAVILRMLDTGLRSVVLTLYFSGKSGEGYSGKTPVEVIDFSVNAVPSAEATQ
jgi:hypothetical protein